MNEPDNTASPANKQALSRRGFVKSSVIYGALITSKAPRAFGQTTAPSNVINVAMIGCGLQGEKQFESITGKNSGGDREKMAVKGVNIVATCDIRPDKRKEMANRATKFGFKTEAYEDFREMLDKQKDIQAVLIASPDFMHHVHTRAALEAGKDVYCEKMMSNTIEGAKDMVLAQRQTNRVLQIGHQRRSNPRYLALRNELMHGRRIFGRITHANAQWNRGTKSGKIEMTKALARAVNPALFKDPKSTQMSELLTKYGYDGKDPQDQLNRFLNWRFYKKYGGGPISDLGAHQIDIFNWMFDATPTAMVASGGVDYYPEYEHYDNVMIIYEYKTPVFTGKPEAVRASYQVLTTTSTLGFFERFMGDQGSVEISEIPKVNQAYPEQGTDWNKLLEERWQDPYAGRKQALLLQDIPDVKYNPWDVPKTWGGPPTPWKTSLRPEEADSRVSKALAAWELGTALTALPHTPHLQNFFDAVRKGDPKAVNCPVWEAYKTCVTVLAANQAIAENRRIEFKPEDFVVA